MGNGIIKPILLQVSELEAKLRSGHIEIAVGLLQCFGMFMRRPTGPASISAESIAAHQAGGRSLVIDHQENFPFEYSLTMDFVEVAQRCIGIKADEVSLPDPFVLGKGDIKAAVLPGCQHTASICTEIHAI